MKIHATPPPVPQKEESFDSENDSNKDPLLGIEEGLELVNSILKSTIENNFEGSSVSASRKSDLDRYLNFQSHSNINMQSPIANSQVNLGENFKTTHEDTDPRKPSTGIHIDNELDHNLRDFLIENQDN